MLFVLECTYIVRSYMVFCNYQILLEPSAVRGIYIYRSSIRIQRRRLEEDLVRDSFRERLTLDIALYQDYLIVLLFDCRF